MTDDRLCPICGQKYDHRRSESPMQDISVRRDINICTVASLNKRGDRTIYMHIDDD